MTYPILPLNLQQLWQDQSDRITRLELAYNGPQVSADAASTLATSASASAAAAAATAASAFATATTATTTANGKNTATYSTSAVSGSGIKAGDLWYQYTSGTGVIIAQWTWNGSSWDSNTLSSAVISSLTAGKITGGVITAAVGITSPSGNFSLNSSTGQLICSGADVTGKITATSGSFTGSIYASSGTIGGWTITGSQLQGFGGTYLDSSAGTIFTDGLISTLGNISANGTITGTTGLAGGTLAIAGAANMNGLLYNLGHATTTNAANVYMNPSSSLIALVTSSERYKVEILSETIPLESVMSLVPKSWIDKAEFEANENSSNGLKRILGVIAEDVAQIPVLKDLLVNYNEQGQPDSINYDRIAITLIPLLQDLQNRVTKLEGANGTTTSN